MEKVLHGIRVLDFGRYIAAPYCGLLLADMGAEVYRVERPGGEYDRGLGPFAPNGDSMGVISLSRNKKGITLNLQKEEGKHVLKDLVRHSDVVIENFGVEAKELLGLTYNSLKESNPAIILISVSGLGQTGPFSKRTAFDPIAQALTGMMSYTGFNGTPPTRAAVPVIDFSTALYATLGTMFALYHRQKTGEGQELDLALLDTAMSFVTGSAVAAEYQLLDIVRRQQGNLSFYNISDSYQAKDGWILISIIGDGIWRRLLRVIDREELRDDPRFVDDNKRYENYSEIREIIQQWLSELTMEEAIARLEESRVPCGKVNTIAEAVRDTQIRARGMMVDIEQPGIGKIPVVGPAFKLSKTPSTLENRAPLVGEHNEEVYCGLLRYSKEKLERLRRDGIV